MEKVHHAEELLLLALNHHDDADQARRDTLWQGTTNVSTDTWTWSRKVSRKALLKTTNVAVTYKVAFIINPLESFAYSQLRI